MKQKKELKKQKKELKERARTVARRASRRLKLDNAQQKLKLINAMKPSPERV